MKSELKKIAIPVVIVFIVFLGGIYLIKPKKPMGADKKPVLTDTQKIELEKSSIQTIQNAEKLKSGKYKYIPKYEKDGKKYEVHEYVMPDGSIGYQTMVNDGKTIKSTCVGNDCDHRVWEITVEKFNKSLEEDL
jgi:hypothetical protein